MGADMERLRQFAKDNDIGFDLLAKAAGMDLSTFYRKIKTVGENFTIGEVHGMVDGTVMTREVAIQIFLPEDLHKCE